MFQLYKYEINLRNRINKVLVFGFISKDAIEYTLIFQVPNEIPVLIFDTGISNNLIENAGNNYFWGKHPNLLFSSKIMHDSV